MIEFMDYVQNAFYSAQLWDRDNSYSTLTATANALLDFQTPSGLHLHVSSLSAANFATSYTLASHGVVDGSVSFLCSSLPMRVPSQSSHIDLRNLIRGYRHVSELHRQDEADWWQIWHRGKRVDKKDTLLYGRLYLPTSTLEALYLRRISPTRLLRLSCVSDSVLPNGGSFLAQLQNDYGKYSTEYLYSTDSALLGIRGLYNFGIDPRSIPLNSSDPAISSTSPADPQAGRISAGAELYFSPLNKSGGISTGVRFTTLPAHTGFPYTMTLTLNPLMGNIASSYAVKVGKNLALSSRFDFNIYSYESDVQVGLELWRRKSEDSSGLAQAEWARKKIRPGWKNVEIAEEQVMALEEARTKREEEVDGVLKARVDQNWKIGVLWEGRVKEMLVSIGADLDLKRRDRPLGSVGLEVSYSS
ncbi:mitochondrial distribution and morphology protein 10 [Delphinella strobiligena]|nr:mitochondrial distribution and morphology protein 10 [Delphinella strobiligena]